nr:hypothetical protein BaRGS_019890 [Batillaria attramentaria]
MGAEESRNGNYGLMGASAVMYNMKRQFGVIDLSINKFLGIFGKKSELQYSRDGHMIFAIMATSGCHCKEKKARRFQPIDISIYVLSGDSTQTLHCIQYHRYTCALHSCPVNYMPVLSMCGSRMAMVLNDLETSIDHVQVYKLPTAGDLQNRCRIRILQRCAPDKLSKLPLPSRLISYLQFKPEAL